ncbi:hypothetical protein YPPY60_4557, partial [Yersinia pestis PY-60]
MPSANSTAISRSRR